MTINVVLVVTVGILVASGVYLLLERSLTRVLVGIVLISNAINILFMVASGPAGTAPLFNLYEPEQMSDPLPQALVLTAIVITLGLTAFILAMAYRSWQVTGSDDVQDDAEDAAIRRLAELDAASQSYDENSGSVIDTTNGTDDDPRGSAGDDAGDGEQVSPPEGEQR
ncbi:MAG TPA: Na(+)/H(+) antiporter subunit C [Jiangellaceae bacterium]|nr:Na(+)/H(+) antiporter subunit C [Jiangellaceae bacterium]